MIAIIVYKDSRTTYDDVLCHEVNYKTNIIKLYFSYESCGNPIDHKVDSVILKKDGVVVDWIWSEELRLEHKRMADLNFDLAAKNRVFIDAKEQMRMYNPFPTMFVGGE